MTQDKAGAGEDLSNILVKKTRPLAAVVHTNYFHLIISTRMSNERKNLAEDSIECLGQEYLGICAVI